MKNHQGKQSVRAPGRWHGRAFAFARPLALAVAAALATAPALAQQDYPTKPIRIVVHIPPGGAPDIAARVVGEKLTESMGQPVLIENKPGANGNIASELVAKSAPDGYTLASCVDSQLVINPHVYPNMSFDPMKDLVPFVSMASNELFLVANPNQPYKTLAEFIAYAKQAKQPLPYGSSGNGSQHHLMMEMLKARAGIDLVHVPFKGSSPATVAAMAGEVPVLFAGASVGPNITAGKLRALAVAAPSRIAAYPDVPAIAELYPGFRNSIWMGLCAPRGTPEPVLRKLRAEVNKALASPDTRSKFARSGALEPMITTPEEFSALIASEYAKYGKVAKDLGVKVD